jgi:hypothetical protein
MWLDLIVEYLSGFSFGLFIFQSLQAKYPLPIRARSPDAVRARQVGPHFGGSSVPPAIFLHVPWGT